MLVVIVGKLGGKEERVRGFKLLEGVERFTLGLSRGFKTLLE